MRICRACNSFFEDEGSFCSKCGNPTIEYVPVVAEPKASPDFTQPAAAEAEPLTIVDNEPADVMAEEPLTVTEEKPVTIIEEEPVATADEEPVVIAAPEPAPIYYTKGPQTTPIQSAPSTGAKVMSYVGMGLGIFGFAIGILILFAAISSLTDNSLFDGTYFITYSMFIAGSSIAGLCLTSKAYLQGIKSSACVTGKALSIVGIIINGLTFLVAFFGIIITSWGVSL